MKRKPATLAGTRAKGLSMSGEGDVERPGPAPTPPDKIPARHRSGEGDVERPGDPPPLARRRSGEGDVERPSPGGPQPDRH